MLRADCEHRASSAAPAQVHTRISELRKQVPACVSCVQGCRCDRQMDKCTSAHHQPPTVCTCKCYLCASSLMMASWAHMFTLLCTALCSHPHTHTPAGTLACKAREFSQHPLKAPSAIWKTFEGPAVSWQAQDQPDGLPAHAGPGHRDLPTTPSVSQRAGPEVRRGPALAHLPPMLRAFLLLQNICMQVPKPSDHITRRPDDNLC